VGTTIGLGLLFDTLIVRSFMTPSIAALLGRWFWWPQMVRPRPASALLQPVGPRPVVRALLLREQPPSGSFPVQDGDQPHGLAEHDHHGRVRVPERYGEAHR
jgi:putative drug exporter of the RND superfamily